MILGIGVDLVDIKRFKSWSKDQCLRVFTDMEFEIANKSENFYSKVAKCWGVKEALLKALGIGFSNGISFKDISLKYDDLGKPIVDVYGKVLDIIKSKTENFNINVSMSDENDMVLVFVIIETI